MLIHAHIQMHYDVTEHLSSRHCSSVATWLLGCSQYMYNSILLAVIRTHACFLVVSFVQLPNNTWTVDY